ncbi:prenyltransferase [Corynebacterium pelargi]|uniref:Prenyltransferase n=1 Tax=Corynebacterium pelargi TaxID=1471400 RepID=A0A410W6I7_9CORY|nr:prenyltransferase [Corynebacterium pelargi]QAU51496.1 prenyltransferase [Corynebacterium pelargi]GGG79570.1 prenyltransferase [Corynebacterium pelargi]
MIKQILHASRPLSWVNTAFPFAAAYLLSGGGVNWLLILGTFFFLIPYNIAMYGINDVFDYESDIRNPRKGGVEGAVLPRHMHTPLLWASAITTLPLLLIMATQGAVAWLLFSAFCVVAYSAPPLRFKERPVLDSATSSAHFVTPAIIGAAYGQPPQGFWLAMASFFLWGMASHALGAVQDVQSDRAGGLHSIATKLGPGLTVRLVVGAYALSALLLFFLPSPAWLIGLAGFGYALNAARFMGVTVQTSPSVNRAWRVFLVLNFVVGAILTMVLLALT